MEGGGKWLLCARQVLGILPVVTAGDQPALWFKEQPGNAGRILHSAGEAHLQGWACPGGSAAVACSYLCRSSEGTFGVGEHLQRLENGWA